MKNKNKYTGKEWEKIASLLSGEATYPEEELARFRESDNSGIEKLWKKMGNSKNDKEIDVDKAWNNVYSRMEEEGLLRKAIQTERRLWLRTALRVAASVIIIVGLGAAMLYLNRTGALGSNIVVSAGPSERNKEVLLPDGSKVFLNRNSRLSYSKTAGKSSRNVALTGEAFFDIKRDPARPFIIDAAGKASVRVLGTSFSVLTNNSNNAVEVFVKTGSVMLRDDTGERSIILEPGYIGTANSEALSKTLNDDRNYLAWNTGLLDFKNTTLDIVFADIKKVYNIEIVADDAGILKKPLTATYEKEPQDTIIKLLCTTFDLKLKKEGTVYHLSER